jgi:proteasome beta subunit
MTENDGNPKLDDMVLTGTTTTGIVCTDGVVMATDTRVTMGYTVAHKHGKKIYPLADHIAMTIAGGVADAQNGVEILQVNAKLFQLERGQKLLFRIDEYGSITEETCVATGSGSPVAYGVLEDGYKDNLSLDEGISLLSRAVASAMKRDAGSGDSFDVAIITSTGYRELTAQEKA